MCKKNKSNTNLDYYKSIVLDNAVECAWVYSLTNECFKYISPSIYNLRGLTVEEAMNESLEDSLTPESLQKIKNSKFKRLSLFLSGDRSESVISDVSEYEQYCKDGSTKMIEISTRLILNEDVQSIDVIGVSRDITRRKLYEKKLIEKLHLKTELLEKQKPIVKDELSHIRIYFFDKFKVYGINQSTPLHWHTSKNEELFAFLLTQENRLIGKDQIIENLWPYIDVDKATAYLHNTLYSMKKDLKSVGIEFNTKFKNYHYIYHLSDYYADTRQFCRILDNTTLPFDSVDQQSATHFEQILSLYKGDFLGQDGYIWSLPQNNKLYEKFKFAALSLSRYYFLKHDYVSTKRVLLRILKIDNFDETIHELLLKLYLQDNDYSSFLHHYEELESFLLSECQTKPKMSIINLYNKFNTEAKRATMGKNAHF